MKTFARLFTFLISLEMILAPLGVNGLISNANAASPESCAAKGMDYNPKQNRCNVKSQVTKTENQVDHCRSITDENARKKCYQRNVDNGSADVGENGYKDSFKDSMDGKGLKSTEARTIGNAAAISLPLFFLMKQLKDGNKFKTCKPASLMLLYSGGGVLALGELVSYIQHRANLNKLEEAYYNWNVKEESESADDNKVKGMNSQAEAFELLAKNQDSIKQVATTKAITYGVATGVFAAGAVMGAVETFQLKAAKLKVSTNPHDTESLNTINRLTCGKQGVKTEATATEATTTDNNSSSNESSNSTETNKSSGTEFLKDGAKTLAPAALNAALGGGKGKEGSGTIPASGPTEDTTSQNGSNGASCGASQPACDSTKGLSCIGPQGQAKICQCASGFTWSGERCTLNPLGTSIDIQDILNLKIKSQAINNIAHAESFEEVIELIEEINTIEYENYSSLSYHDSEVRAVMKTIRFDQAMARLISESFMMSAYAQDETRDGGTIQEVVITAPVKAQVIKPADLVMSTPKTPEVDMVEMQKSLDNTILKIQGERNVAAANREVKGILNKAFYLPLGRASLNTLLGTWMGIMTGNMMKNIKDAKERAAYLRSIKADFETTGGITACGSSDRNNPQIPICYCYTSDNSFNPARANSQVCANKYVGVNQYPNAADGAYDQKSCVNQNYEVDTACACKKNNSCVKVSQISGMGIDPGTFRMLGSMVAPANDLTNGQASPASINSASIGNNAAKVKKKADELMKQIPEVKKTTGNLEKSLLASTSGLKASSGFGASGGSSLSNFNPSQAAAELKKEIEENKEAEIRSVGIQNSGSGEATTESLEFGLTEDMLNSQESEIAEIMQKDLDMGSNDINNNDSTNIFEVLSNRYKRSGMRRLFDENNSAPAEKPASSDISE